MVCAYGRIEIKQSGDKKNLILEGRVNGDRGVCRQDANEKRNGHKRVLDTLWAGV